MFTKFVFKTSQALLILLLASGGCKHNDNPISSGGFPTEAGPILFISDKSGSEQLYSMNEDGSNVRQLSNDPNFPISDAKWSPDGRKIAVVSLIGDEMTHPSFRNAIFVMDADGKNRRQLTQQWFYSGDSVMGSIEYGGAISPVWSPDSKQIAFSRMMVPEELGNLDIFIMNVDETNERRITGTIGYSEACSEWSATSLLISRIDWSARDSLGRGIQHTTADIIDTEGHTLNSFGKPSESWDTPKWGPTYNKIFISLDSDSLETQEILQFDVGNGTLTKLAGNDFKYYGLVSVGTDRILFNSTNTYSYNHIWLMGMDGTNSRDITPFPSNTILATSWRR